MTADKLFIILLIAVFLIGPTRLPVYAAKFGAIVRSAKRLINEGTERVKSEMGPEFDDVDWKSLDPRQYDPRAIVRRALSADDPPK